MRDGVGKHRRGAHTPGGSKRSRPKTDPTAERATETKEFRHGPLRICPTFAITAARLSFPRRLLFGSRALPPAGRVLMETAGDRTALTVKELRPDAQAVRHRSYLHHYRSAFHRLSSRRLRRCHWLLQLCCKRNSHISHCSGSSCHSNRTHVRRNDRRSSLWNAPRQHRLVNTLSF